MSVKNIKVLNDMDYIERMRYEKHIRQLTQRIFKEDNRNFILVSDNENVWRAYYKLINNQPWT